ncbi:GNAT family N-acetyltransferase [Labrys miyagiensis]|nr:GNAT family N-acetyltransferase [Labrys miyagiensis]
MLKIRPFAPDDIPQLVLLLQEMQRHYGVPVPAADAIRASLNALPAGAGILLAETDAIMGFVAFSSLYPGPGLKPGLFMKELFVSERARGQGVGKALLRALARLALERGFARIDWTADRRNERLQRFYAELGAQAQEDRVFFRLSADALVEVAGATLEQRAGGS